jgi:DNA polymerase (family 10)
LRGTAGDAEALRRAVAAVASLPPTATEDERRQRWASAALDARTRWRAEEAIAGHGPALLDAAFRELPRDFAALLDSHLLSPADLVLLHRRLGILTTGDLALGLEGHIVAHRGVPDDVAGRARAALEVVGDHHARLTLGRAWDAVEPVVTALRTVSSIQAVEVAGSLRRVRPTVRDLRVVAATSDPEGAYRALDAATNGMTVRFHGPAGLTLLSGNHEVSVKIAAPDRYGAALVFHTGSRDHLSALQRRAEQMRHRLNPDALVSDGITHETSAEADVYARLGLPWIPPELRRGTDEIDRALAGALPRLVEPADIRGDLHMHTTWSDGRDTLDAMVAAGASLGYEYVAITDHSESSAASRTIARDALARQGEAIDRLQEQYPRMRILKGIEVDILPDGRLDFPDSLLESLDLVLASLHDAAGHSPERLLRRYRNAAEHPLVSVLTHPANRLVGRFDGYAIDFDALFDIAARTGTILEIDGAPSHLDMDGDLARRAIAAGVTVSIDSDCHQARLLQRQMRLGVGTARRGWVEAGHVVNTRATAGLLPLLQRKRHARA